MRNLKKFLAVVVAIAVMMTAMIPAFAADTTTTTKTDADICKNLKVLTGGTDGVTPEYLAKDTQRIQAAIVLLRLLGKEAEAKAFDATGKETFKDAGKVQYAEGKNILAYLKAHPEYGFKGYTDGNFGVEDLIKPQQLYKVLLQAMGFAQDTDYKYAEIAKFAESKGLAKIATLATLTNNDVAVGIVEAFKGTEKGGKKFVEKLIADKLITEAAAAAEGLVTVSGLAASVEAVGASKIKVTYNKAVDTAKAAVALNKGVAPVAVASITWNDAKTEATLTTAIKLTKGDYTVKTTGLAETVADKTITVEDEKVVKFEITATGVQKINAAPIAYTLQNQYKEDKLATASDYTITATNLKTGLALTPGGIGSDGAVKVDGSTSTIDDKVVVIITYKPTGQSATATLPVVAAAKIGEFTASPATWPSDEKRIVVSNSDDDYKIPYVAKDQFGGSIKLTKNAANATAIANNDGIAILSSDNTIIDPANVKTNADSELTFRTGAKDGSVTLTFVMSTTGKSTTLAIVVNPVAKMKTFTMTQPTTLATSGAALTVKYDATDSFDQAVAKKDVTPAYRTAGSITFMTSNASIVDVTPVTGSITWNTQNDMIITPKGKGVVTITPYVGGVVQTAITLDVQDAVKATKVVGVKDIPVSALTGASITLKAENFKILDQYGRTMDLPSAYKLSIKLKDEAADTFKFVASGASAATTYTTNAAITSTTTDVAITALKDAGSEGIYVELNDGSAAVADSSYEFSFKAIKDDAVASYVIEDPGLYFADANNGATTNNKSITVNGLDASGAKVALYTNKVSNITVDNRNFTISGSNMWSTAKGTANISAWVGADKVATIAVTSSDAARVVTSVKFNKAENTITANNTTVAADMEIKDQYGVAMSDSGKYYGSDDAVATVNLSTGAITKIGSGSITLTYVSTTGIKATTTVKVN